MAMSLDRIKSLAGKYCGGARLPSNGAGISVLTIRMGSKERGGFAHFIFPAGKTRPACVIQHLREARFNETLFERERTLRLIRERLDGSAVRDTLPRILGLEDVDGFAVLVQSFVEGRLGWAPHLSRRGRAVQLAAARWLGEFQTATRTEKPSAPGAQSIAERALRDYAGLYSLDVAEREKIETLRADLPNWIGDVRVCASHGDFSPVNTRLAGRRFGVVDWEYAVAEELPFLDAATWIGASVRTYAGLEDFGRWTSREREVRRIWTAVAGDFLRSYARAAALPTDIAERGLPLGFIQIAVLEARISGAGGAGDSSGRFFFRRFFKDAKPAFGCKRGGHTSISGPRGE